MYMFTFHVGECIDFGFKEQYVHSQLLLTLVSSLLTLISSLLTLVSSLLTLVR